MDLRVLASKLEKSSDELLVRASSKGKELFDKVAVAIAAASTLLEDVADDMDKNASFEVSPEYLDELASLASFFDKSDDPALKKHASVLDELLLSIAAPKNAIAQARKVTDDEINRLRDKHRQLKDEEAYVKPREELHQMWSSEAQAKAVDQQVKQYIPLEAPLQTRCPPDRPGGQMTRITDGVYQDIATGIIYDFKNGYTTQKGNKIPGGSVENQTRQLSDSRNYSTSVFQTRDSIMGRYSSDGDFHHLKKYAFGNEIASALKVVRDYAPQLLSKAIDCAFEDGLSTTEVGNILATDVTDPEKLSFESNASEIPSNVVKTITAAGWGHIVDNSASKESMIATAIGCIQELAPHLLKSAIAKAKQDGLTDQQIKSVLVSDLRSKFKSNDKKSEMKTADVLIPQLKALGWDDLAQEQLKVMAGMGISQESLGKFSEEPVVKKNSLNRLRNLLRQAAVSGTRELEFEDSDFPELELDTDPKLELAVEPQTKPVVPAPLPQSVLSVQPIQPMQPVKPVVPPVQSVQPDVSSDDKKIFQYITQTSTADLIKDLREEDDLQSINGMKDAVIRLISAFTKANDTKSVSALTAYLAILNLSLEKFEQEEYEEPEDVEEPLRVVGPAETKKQKAPIDMKKKEEFDAKGAASVNGSFNWERYQNEHKVRVTQEDANKLESEIQQLRHSTLAKFDAKFSNYRFDGKPMPAEFGGNIPDEIKQEIIQMFKKGDRSAAIIKYLEDKGIEKYFNTHPEILDKYQATVGAEYESLSEDAVKKKSDAEAAAKEADSIIDPKAKEKKMSEARKLFQEAESAERGSNNLVDQLTNRKELRQKCLESLKKKILLPEKTMLEIHTAISGPQNKAKADLIRSEFATKISKHSVNEVLEMNGLPAMYPESEEPSIVEFEGLIDPLGKTHEAMTQKRKLDELEKKNRPSKERFYYSPPEKEVQDQRGNIIALKEIQEDPVGYMKARAEAYAKFPSNYNDSDARKKEQRDKRDSFMNLSGYVALSEKIYGAPGSSGNTQAMLYGIPFNSTSNPIAKTDGYTIFNNPEGYIRAYLEGKDKFRKPHEDPKEWSQIHAGPPADLLSEVHQDDRQSVIDFVSRMMSSDKGVKADAFATLKKLDKDSQEFLKAIYNKEIESGELIRKKILGLMFPDKRTGEVRPLEDIKAIISETFPDAYIPEGVIEEKYEQFHDESNKEAFAKWMEDRGFYSPYKILIGNKTTKEILDRGKSGYRPPFVDPIGQRGLSEIQQSRSQMRKFK